MEHRIGIFGCGTIGGGLVSLLDDKRGYLAEKYGFEFRVCFISSLSRGVLVNPGGVDLADVRENLRRNGSILGMSGARRGPVPADELLREMPVDIACDTTPTNYETGQPSRGVLEASLSSGANAVTCSKGGVGTDLAGLKAIAAKKGVKIRFESSVMSGTPLVSLVRGPLAGCEITRAEGIVNGTTNYILTKMEEGADYASALSEAQRLGYAETDPTGDVEGFDAAVKVCIMASEFFGSHVRVPDVERVGITGVTSGDVSKALSEGRRIKLIAGVERDSGRVRCYVQPRAIEESHPLASVRGAANAISITTDNLGVVTVTGPGAGARETAQGIIADMLEIAGWAG
ncbi:MAG: homoserine dehydrogenase [Synergistaceae bacterium]|jgi:homoserine dehydrogenase|nr:homoserine dehydrogenase [Synergistaceae bacterium]